MRSRRLDLTEKQKTTLFWSCFAGLLFLFLGFLIYGGLQKEFWYDEMAMVGFVGGDTTIPDILHTYLTVEASNLPLYALLLWPVYHCLPAQEVCLLSLSMLLTFGGVAFLGLFAHKRYGKPAAILSLALCLCSNTVRNRIGLELRAYSLMFFGGTFSLYMLLLLHEKRSKRRYVLTGLALVILVFSHYFGVLTFAILAGGALVVVLCRREKKSYLAPFIAAGLLFVPWFAATRMMTSVSSENFWIPRPAFADVPKAVAYLLGGNAILCGLFGLGWIMLLAVLIRKKQWISPESFMLLTPVAVLGGVFVYSRYLSKGGGLFENRYFIAVLPMLLLTVAAAFQQYWDLCEKKKALRILPLLLLLPALYMGNHKAHVEAICQMRDASDSAVYLLQQGDLEDDDVKIVALSYDPIGDYCAYGWADFYLRRQGGVQKEVFVTQDSIMDELFDEYIPEGIRKIYIMGDKDFLDYFKDDYRRIELEDTRRMTVFELR